MLNLDNLLSKKIFLILFPFIYLSGPLATELFLIFITLNSILYFETFKKKIIYDNRFIQIFFIIIFFQSFLYYPEINFKNLMYIRFYFYYISILVLFSKNDKIEKILYNFFKSIIFILIFLVLFHLQQIIFGFDTIDNRITIPIRQEEIAVSIYTKFYPFILMILLFSSKSQKNDEFFKNTSL